MRDLVAHVSSSAYLNPEGIIQQRCVWGTNKFLTMCYQGTDKILEVTQNILNYAAVQKEVIPAIFLLSFSVHCINLFGINTCHIIDRMFYLILDMIKGQINICLQIRQKMSIP